VAITGRSLDKAASRWCDDLNRLLNKTVTRARMVATAGPGQVSIALREGSDVGAKVKTRYGSVILSLQQRLRTEVDAHGMHRLHTVRYRYSLAASRRTAALVRWDYLCADDHGGAIVCRHHIQGTLPVQLPKETLRLDDFHMPTGYVAIEEVLRFLLADLDVPALSDEWDQLLRDSYAAFRKQRAEVWGPA